MAVPLEIVGRTALIILGIVTLILSALVLSNCEFMELHWDSSYGDSDEAMGLFGYHYDGKCEEYDDDDQDHFDGYLKAARAFGVLASLLVSFSLITHTLVLLVLKDSAASITWNVTRFGLWPAAVLATGLTFLIFGNDAKIGGVGTKEYCDHEDADCGLGPAAVLAICNMVFLLIMIGVSFFLPTPEQPIFSCEGGTCGINGAEGVQNSVVKQSGSGGAGLAPPPGMFKLTVSVPKGPMGLTMGQRGPNEGHTVSVVKPDSPLQGAVQVGDELVMINNVDLTKMSEKGMMGTLRAHADQSRTLTLFRESPVEAVSGDEMDLDV